MRKAAEKRAARERERARQLQARERAQHRKARRKDDAQRRREEKRTRAVQKKQRAKDTRESIKAGEDNLFNGVSVLIHALAANTFSNMRLSLGLRISWNYSAKVLSLMIRELLIGLALFIAAEWFVLSRDVRDMTLSSLDAGTGIEYKDVHSAVPAVEAYAVHGSTTDAYPLKDVVQFTGGLLGIEVADWSHWRVWFMAPQREYDSALTVVCYDIRYHMLLFYGVMGLVALVNLTSVLGFLLSGRQINQRVLAPIGQITETAQKLSENDLGRRINVEGTNNELRDLAQVINEMLDRIEMAYNAQKQFVSDASHELRTPIAVIQGYANLLERWGKDSPEVRDEAISAILSESGAMKELVEKLLFLARHDKKTLRLKVERFDISEVVEETLRETRMIVKDRTIEAGEISSIQVDADRASIKQALRIFVDNAAKYTPPGGKVTVSCKKKGTDVAVAVSDTGVGISGSELSAIFERFYRADAARSGETPGHGLGLSIAKIIVLSHKGRIRVNSKVGAGSTFTMELPRV